MRFLFATLLCLPTLAHSEGFETKIAADLNGDGISDFAELTQDGYVNSATLTLSILRSDGSEDYSVVAPGFVWVGGIGQEPELRMTEHGSLQAISMNEATGRSHWHQVLTIAYRDDSYKIAGFTYYWNDTLDAELQGVCDINLLNGRGEMTHGSAETKTDFRTDMRAIPIADWPHEIPQDCLDRMN